MVLKAFLHTFLKGVWTKGLFLLFIPIFFFYQGKKAGRNKEILHQKKLKTENIQKLRKAENAVAQDMAGLSHRALLERLSKRGELRDEDSL